MNTEIELDHKVLQKNLELTKALQTVDRLVSENINLNAKLNEYAEEITRLTANSYEDDGDIIFKQHYEALSNNKQKWDALKKKLDDTI